MGIQGLLPLLKSIQLPISIAELSGHTVGVDAYCWLHKGAYGCALQLAEGKDSDVYINYVMRRVNMMLYHNVKPVLVFDGGYLPSKSEKEAERRSKRREYKAQGLLHLRKGNRDQAFECFQKSIDITPEMAFNVIKTCRGKGVDCIVAPYEADSQLAYLMKAGITQFTISEDSDLLVFGCEKVIFKMDANGSGVLISLTNLPRLTVLRMDGFTERKFREMCILAGCDYLPSVKGMGLMTAHKLLRKHSTVNKLIGTLRLNNKMKVPRDYEAKFAQAEQAFLYQIVFDPNTNKLVPLNPVPDDIDAKELYFAGHGKWKQEQAVDLALGNLNPITGKRMGNFTTTKVVTCDKQEKSSRKKGDEMSTPTRVHNKGPHSVLSSKGKYEAQKNLNGSFRETKSSDKTSTAFVTPMRTQRMRSDAEKSTDEQSKLAKLYSTTSNEHCVRHGTEDVDNDDQSFKTTKNPIAQARKKFRNPFRSPVIGPKRSEEHVVSKYFGLAGMETLKQEQLAVDETLSTGYTVDHDSSSESQTKCSLSFPISLSPRRDSPNFNECSALDVQDSGYCSQLGQDIESSPPQESTERLHESSPSPLSPKPRKFASGMVNLSSKRKNSMNCENRQPAKKKLKSTQTSLDRFAFVKCSTTIDITEPTTSPKRTVLGDNSSQNCMYGELNGEQDCKDKQQFKKEGFTKVLGNDLESGPEDGFGETQESSETIDLALHGTQPNTIALREKPITGLGRCRPVGLNRRKTGDIKKSNGVEMPLLSFFAYRGRSSKFIS